MKKYQYASKEQDVVFVVDEDGISRMSMLALAVPDDVEIEPYQEPPKTQEQLQLELKAKEERLWQAADAYQSSFISGVAIGLLTIGVLQQKPKALAIQAWSASIWDQYYSRKALITEDSPEELDFSACGPIPHSVPELRAELGL